MREYFPGKFFSLPILNHIEILIMDYNGIWEDCIDKMDDLGCNIDELSATVLPKLSLSQDPIVGPLILSIMNDVIDLE